MLYFHDTACISAQQTFGTVDLETLRASSQNKLYAQEPPYREIPPGLLRRMGRAVRMSVGAGMSLMKPVQPLQGILVGTANGGMEDCIKFLNQIVEYQEGILAPGNFVQSTANAIAAQLGLLSKNKNYNITHAHRGLSFENALMDGAMHVLEQPRHSFLVGGVDEISSFNYNIDRLDGWYKEEAVSSGQLYGSQTPASLAGEGAAFFVINGSREGALAKLQGLEMFETDDLAIVTSRLNAFLSQAKDKGADFDLVLTGENGDVRHKKFWEALESQLGPEAGVCRFKHMTGEFPTASALGLWLGIQLLERQRIPEHMVKKPGTARNWQHLLLYNQFKGSQHALIWISLP